MSYLNEIDYSDLGIEDVNADGLPEWTIMGDTPTYYEGHCGDLYVLGWKDNTLVNLLRADRAFCGPARFTNLDNDPALEIQYNESDSNTWGCDSGIVEHYDWDGQQYALTRSDKIEADSLACALYKADPLMWDGQFEEAVPLYEHGLAVAAKANIPMGGMSPEGEWLRYAQARLVLAYALTGQTEKASELLGELKIQKPESPMMSTLIGAMSKAQPNAVSLCTAAYNVFWDYSQSTTGHDLSSSIVVGRSEYPCCVGDNGPPEPEKAGCDAPQLIDYEIGSNTFRTDSSPVEQLEQRDIEVESSYHADLNADGREEWLVWLVAQVDPILFVPLGNTYYYSRPPVHRPSPYAKLQTLTLPDDAGIALVDWIYLDPPQDNLVYGRYDIHNRSCLPEPGESYRQSSGEMKLWRLIGLTLQPMLEMPLCERAEINDIFQKNGHELKGWSIQVKAESYNDQFGPAVYSWDTQARNYISPSPTTVEIVQTSVAGMGYLAYGETPSPNMFTEATAYDSMNQAAQAIAEQRFDKAFTVVDEQLKHQVPDLLPLFANGLHYYRALALEALGQDDEALKEYVTIYEAAPESAWGRLARLHLEPLP